MAGLDHAGWYVAWCEPLVVALYQRDQEAIRQKLETAKAGLASQSVSGADATYLGNQLAYLEYQAHLVLNDPGWTKNDLPQIEARLAMPSPDRGAERLRRRLYLQMRISLDRLGRRELRPAEFARLFSAVPEEEHSTELWLHVSGWAFKFSQVRYLEQAYEFALLQGRGFNAAWTWQRVHVMWKLVSGEGTREHIEWLLEQAELPQQLRSVKTVIWPRAREMGLVDERLERRIQEREAELNTQPTLRLRKAIEPYVRDQANVPA